MFQFGYPGDLVITVMTLTYILHHNWRTKLKGGSVCDAQTAVGDVQMCFTVVRFLCTSACSVHPVVCSSRFTQLLLSRNAAPGPCLCAEVVR